MSMRWTARLAAFPSPASNAASKPASDAKLPELRRSPVSSFSWKMPPLAKDPANFPE